MIQFPLRITYYHVPSGRWKAYVQEHGLELVKEGLTAAEAVGGLLLQLKDVPGFHLWTFTIVGLDDGSGDPPADTWKNPTPDEMAIYSSIGKMNAIKAYRQRTGLGLREAKEAVERQAALRSWR